MALDIHHLVQVKQTIHNKQENTWESKERHLRVTKLTRIKIKKHSIGQVAIFLGQKHYFSNEENNRSTERNLPSGQQDPWPGLHQLTFPQSSFVPFQKTMKDKEPYSNSTNVVHFYQYEPKNWKSYPSEARILTRATTCPGLGFLEREFPITGNNKMLVQHIRTHVEIKKVLGRIKSHKNSNCVNSKL